ncbi:MAG: beta-ketoacyl-ACP synthase 3, partial [bacterium]
PSVKKSLREHNISEAELHLIQGSGREGRITSTDLQKYVTARKTGPEAAVKTKPKCNIAAIGTYVPDHVVKNNAFAGRFEGINENYIVKVTGIEERRYTDSSQTTSDLAAEAGKRTLDTAEMDASRLDLIIVATSTPDLPLPACACAVQQKLHAKSVPAFDISAACSGWLYGLSVAKEFIDNGTMKNILVIGAECMSRFVNPMDKATAFLFGDGAGAALVSSELKGHALSQVYMETDGTLYDIILRRAGGASYPIKETKIFVDDFLFSMDGHRMFREGVASFRDIINIVLRKEKKNLDDFKWIVPHQANRRMLRAIAHEIKVPADKIFSNIQYYGNTSAASIPLAVKELETRDLVSPGDKLLLCSVGAGVTTAGCVISW